MGLTQFISSLQIGYVLNIKKYKKGQQNDTYKVKTDKGIYSLRIYNYKNLAQIKFETALLNHIKGLQTPQLVKFNNSFIKKFNYRHVIVYKYLLGNCLKKFTPKQLFQIGSFMGKFHKKCENFTWNQWRYQFYDLPDWKINKLYKIIKNSNLKYKKYLPTIIEEIKKSRLSKNLPHGPIHADIKPENVLFNKKKLSGVIDFDNSYLGPFILDLAKSMIWFGIKNKILHLDDIIHIFRGYISKRKLNLLEKKELYKSIKFAFLSHIYVDFYMRAMGVTNQKYFEWIINNLYKTYLNLHIKKEEFNKLLKIY